MEHMELDLVRSLKVCTCHGLATCSGKAVGVARTSAPSCWQSLAWMMASLFHLRPLRPQRSQPSQLRQQSQRSLQRPAPNSGKSRISLLASKVCWSVRFAKHVRLSQKACAVVCREHLDKAKELRTVNLQRITGAMQPSLSFDAVYSKLGAAET